MKNRLRLLSLLMAMLLLSACAAMPLETDNSANGASHASDGVPEAELSSQEGSIAQPKPEKGKSYEEHLGALTLFALSIEYPDFSLNGIYTDTEVAIANKENSNGIYVLFDSMGEEVCAHVYPIAQERTETGTMDLYAAELGFAAFDLMEEPPATEELTPLQKEVFSVLLADLNAVSLYSH